LKKILTIVGARPQFIKAATVSRAIASGYLANEVIVHTGQHFDSNMSEVFFSEMDIPSPKYNLNIHSLSHGSMTGRMIEKIEEVIFVEKPDCVLVYGDTNSTLAGALAAKKINLPVAHVEAGLRSFNMAMPEEINRVLTDRISDFLYCPTVTSVTNLVTEGFSHFNCKIELTGDVMYDAALHYGRMSADRSNIIQQLGLKNRRFVVGTLHRQENTDNPELLRSVIDALNEIHLVSQVVMPIHPRTRKLLIDNKIKTVFQPIDPVGYFDMVELLKHCELVVTDSGGMQKEAFFFGKYCITMREETEWSELVENGYNMLTGADSSKILSAWFKMAGNNMPKAIPLYGDGNASEKIVNHLFNHLP